MLNRLVAGAILAAAVFACSDPTAVDTTLRPGQFVSVSAGRYHACALDTLGRGWCWGDDSYGQSADPCIACTKSPAPIETALRFSAISAGATHTCALTSDGSAWCWGDNNFGQLGATSSSNCIANIACSMTPLAVNGGHHFKSITAGTLGTCAITLTDVLKCWGYQGFSNTPSNPAPTTVRYPATGDSTWSQVSHTDGGLTGCGLTAGGVAACWGSNNYGQLGVGGVSSSRSNPVAIALDAVVTSMSVASGYACALTSLSDVYCWGVSRRGGLGVGADAASSPCSATAPDACYATPLKVIGGIKFTRLALGFTHACGIDVAGDTYCWGSNSEFAIGSASLGSNLVAPSPFPAANGARYTSLAAGSLFTCGVRTDKNISCWGSNFVGQLGQPSQQVGWSMFPLVVAPNTP